MKKVIIFLLLMLPSFAKHEYNEKYYQNIWCRQNNGVSEYILPDKTRVDCLTKDYAVEFDFASKWAESIGQSLYYAKMTKKKPAVALIMEQGGDEKYYKRLEVLSKDYNITLFRIKSRDYKNYSEQTDFVSELIKCFKNWLKLILIDIINKL